MFLRNRWYAAALSDELGDTPLARTLLDEPVVLYRAADGRAVALEDRCCHRQAPLSLGVVVGNDLRCGYHGLTFDPAGTCVRVPNQSRVPPGAGVRSFPVIERFGLAFIWMGAPALADPATCYDFPYGAQPGWRAIFAKFYARCDFRLLVDNLMDLSHLEFAHATTIGAAGVAENADLRNERVGENVRVIRWMHDIPPAPAHVQATGKAVNVDRWQEIEYTPPGYVWLHVGSAVAGTGVREGRRDGVILDRHSLHLVTPETATTTHYFWTSAHATDQVGPAQEQVLLEQSIKAFNEDLTIIEGQQRRLNGAPFTDINADAGVLQVRRLYDRLLADEAARAAAPGRKAG